MAGLINTICVGLFSTTTINPTASDGLFLRRMQMVFLKQIAAIFLSVVHSFSLTLFLLKSFNCLIPVKASSSEEKERLDMSYHGEIARDTS